ncbi:MAG: hypothetical protein J6S58_03060 [Lentisphaeria bacterium]|nr:hypothetical protein [Lentisphaeria bacterium]
MSDLQKFFDEHFVDGTGVVYSQINGETFKVLEDDFFPADLVPRHWEKDFPTEAEFWTYENCGMTTGGYLSTLCCRLASGHGTEKERTSLLRQAQRTFKALRYIYEIGSQWEEGFFPKIWGNKFSHQTSTDQYLYAMFGMDQYYSFASEEERFLIREMIIAMTEFWMKRKYTLTYYHVNDMVWPPLRFPPFLMLASKYAAGEKKEILYQEGMRILMENLHKIPENSRRKSGRIFQVADAVTMDTMNIILMLENGSLPSSVRSVLLEGMEKMWFEARQTLTEDGFYCTSMPCDKESGRVLPGTEAQYGPRSAWSSMIVRAGLQMSCYLPHLKEETLSWAQLVMEKLTPGTMYYYHPADVERMAGKPCYTSRFSSGDAIVNCLWTASLLEMTNRNERKQSCNE